jgi:hypothetical protein
MIDRTTVIQMALTNNLKRIFPAVDSSATTYRGLFLIDIDFTKLFRSYPQLLAKFINKNAEKK